MANADVNTSLKNKLMRSVKSLRTHDKYGHIVSYQGQVTMMSTLWDYVVQIVTTCMIIQVSMGTTVNALLLVVAV